MGGAYHADRHVKGGGGGSGSSAEDDRTIVRRPDVEIVMLTLHNAVHRILGQRHTSGSEEWPVHRHMQRRIPGCIPLAPAQGDGALCSSCCVASKSLLQQRRVAACSRRGVGGGRGDGRGWDWRTGAWSRALSRE